MKNMSNKGLFWLCIFNIFLSGMSVVYNIIQHYGYMNYLLPLLAIIVNSIIAFVARCRDNDDEEDFIEDEYDDWV